MDKKFTYAPLACVWEITMGCNMRCSHCGSACTGPQEGELTTEEAFGVIDQLADLGLRWLTLSGGEPLTRQDWPLLAKRLTACGIETNMITNGWLVTEKTVRDMVESGLTSVAISIDGPKEIHDEIRCEGSFDHSQQAFKMLKDAGMYLSVITTISKKNIDKLSELREILLCMGVNSWQLQFALPMGSFETHKEDMIEPEQIDDIIDFCYQHSLDKRIIIYPADCIGYYNRKEIMVKQRAFNSPERMPWNGCSAGIRSIGVLHNGDILGCTSIRDREFIEGNVRERPLRSIWEDENSFAWRRNFNCNELAGDCLTCKFSAKCLGGCANSRLTVNGSVYSENIYCSYNVALKKSLREIEAMEDTDMLFLLARESYDKAEYQLAAQQLSVYLSKNPENAEAWRLKGFAEFACSNYLLSQEANEKALAIDPHDRYSQKGRANAIFRQGRRGEAIDILSRVVEETNYGDLDAIHDLVVFLNETGDFRRAAQLSRLLPR